MLIGIDKENFDKNFIRNIDTHQNTARYKLALDARPDKALCYLGALGGIPIL